MTVRQSISFTRPNADWLKAQVESEEYVSKSDVVNTLIRRARADQQAIDMIRARLVQAEQSGIVSQSREEILAEFKAGLRPDG